MIIENAGSFESAQPDIDQIEIDGRNGVLLVDNERLKPVNRSFPFSFVTDHYRHIAFREEDAAEWLSAKGFKNLELSWDQDYIYKAAVVNSFDVTETVRKFGKGTLDFLIHPIKYLKIGQIEKTISNGGVLFNPTKRKAYPKITLTGTGNVTITINDQSLVLKNITGGIVIDNENLTVTYRGQSQYDWLYSDFVHLDKGKNVISWDNSAFTLKIIPNYGVKV